MCKEYQSCCRRPILAKQLNRQMFLLTCPCKSEFGLWLMYVDGVIILDRLPNWRLAQSNLGTVLYLLQRLADKIIGKGQERGKITC